MKRSVFGFVLLVLLLAGGLTVSRTMEHIHFPAAQALDAAARWAMAGDWTEAEQAAAHGAACWEKHWKFSAALADHQPMEDINTLFSQLEIYRAAEEQAEYAAICRELAGRLEAMAQAHTLHWWNLL